MRIGIDAGCLGVVDIRLKTGVYSAVSQIIYHLSKIDKKNSYILYSQNRIQREYINQLGNNFQNKVAGPSRFWLTVGLSKQIITDRLDLFIGFNQALPFIKAKKNLVVVHDLAFELFPQYYPLEGKRLSRLTKFAVRRADKIVAVSNSTKKDIGRLYKVAEDKIQVIYHGKDDCFKPVQSTSIGKIRKKYHIANPYFLYVGSFKPVKNIINLLKGYAYYSKNNENAYPLVLAGSDYWMERDMQKMLDLKYPYKGVINLGFLLRKDLPALYSGSISLVSPSYYEGFGLPILEAMASGIPVIASDRGSIKEITDGSQILVNPDNLQEIGEAMLEVVRNKQLRSKMIKKGLEKSKQFAWKKTANEYLKVINDLTRL